MLKKHIKYEDYDGNIRDEDFFFNLTRAEVTELELSYNGGLVKKINQIVAAQSNSEIIKIFKDLILLSYGVKSLDGRKFIKNEEVRSDFEQTEAYSQLFMELAMNAEAATEFVNGIVPQPQKEVATPFPTTK